MARAMDKEYADSNSEFIAVKAIYSTSFGIAHACFDLCCVKASVAQNFQRPPDEFFASGYTHFVLTAHSAEMGCKFQ